MQNALIESTQLGYEDHGILTFWLHLDYGDSGHQGFGGYQLDSYDKELKRKVASSACGAAIAKILEVCEVDSWEKVPGKIIRVEREAGFNGLVRRIGHPMKDIWFDPRTDLVIPR